MLPNQPLILTLTLNPDAFAFFNHLRKTHFPAERNFLNAHLTLFHHLPPGETKITENITEAAAQQPVVELKITEVVSTGRGVAYRVVSPELSSLHAALQKAWKPWLTPQDAQKLWPHITVQNKVSSEEARTLLQKLSADFVPFTAYGTELALWSYQGGPWAFIKAFPFSQKERPYHESNGELNS